MLEKKLYTRYYRKEYGGLLFLHTLETIFTNVIVVNELKNHHNKIKCHWYYK